MILDKPFLGALVLRLPVIAGNPSWCKTSATDARSFYYNPEYIDALSLNQVEFVLAHEALHCALAHFVRRGHRNKQRWDLACDLAINPLLVKDGFIPPPEAMMLDEFDGMTAEEIYPCLDENNNDEPMDQHIYDGDSDSSKRNPPPAEQNRNTQQSETEKGGTKPQGAPQPAPLSMDEREKLAVQWRQRLAGAAQQAMQAGKLQGALARLVEQFLQTQVPWRALLAKYMSTTAREDYSYMRPSRREGSAIFPSMRSSQIDVVIVVDTSGSITDEEIQEFLSEIDALKGQVKARVTLLACDTRLADGSPWVFEPWEEVKLPEKFPGGGGTSFIPPFDWVRVQDRLPDLLVYFTDAKGDFPKQEPACSVIWLVKGKTEVPWGQRIQLN